MQTIRESKWVIWLTLLNSTFVKDMAETEDRNLEARTEAKSVKECCLFSFSYGLPSLIYYTIQAHLHRVGQHLQWAKPSHMNHKSRKCSTDMPTVIPVHGSKADIYSVTMAGNNLLMLTFGFIIEKKVCVNSGSMHPSFQVQISSIGLFPNQPLPR
jgi:hypothetical protein